MVGNLFAGGIGEQLHRGDTIGVWTYTDDLHAGQFPLQRWTPQTRDAIARNIVDFLKSRKYEKKSRLAPVMAQLKTVVADSDKITVLLISDGEEALTGTPYDAAMAEAYRTNTADQRKQKMPFVTVLRAVKGKFIGFKVNTPPWPVEFPAFPAEPKPIAVVAAVPEAKPEPPPEVTPQPKPEPKVEVTPQIELPPVLLTTNPSPATNVLPAARVAAPEIAPLVQPVVATTSPPSTSPPTPDLPLAASNPPPVIPPVVETPKTSAVVEPSAVEARAEKKSLSLPLLLAGGVLLTGIVGWIVFWLFWPRPQPGVSLITRSIDRDPK